MGSNNPWSPNWRPDPSGRRLASIRAARRGALLAGVVYAILGLFVLAVGGVPRELVGLALVVGLPGVALLGAGLAPSTIGSPIDAVMAGIAFAIGTPVAAVTSIVIGAFVLGLFTARGADLAGPILRAGVLAAFQVEPVVVLGAAVWVVALRRLSPPGA